MKHAVGLADAQRIAVLENVCRGKDSTIYELKQEILALETKVFHQDATTL
jgi:hypothetical protein